MSSDLYIQPKKYFSIDMTEDSSIYSSPLESRHFFLDVNKCTNNALPSSRSQATCSSRVSIRNFLTTKEKFIPEVDLESSSSVILEDSQDFIFLNSKKPHGSHGSFSHQYGINLKKIRQARYSEHMPQKVLGLQIDEDVQPEIAPLRGPFANIEIRKRAQSLYTKAKNKKSLGNLALISQESRESIVENSEAVIPVKSQFDSESEGFNYDIDGISQIDNEIEINEDNDKKHMIFGKESPKSKMIEENINNNYDRQGSKSIMCMVSDRSIEDVKKVNESCVENIPPDHSSVVSSVEYEKSRSIDTVIDINGKIFIHFDKRLLCQIPVCSFSDIIDELKHTNYLPNKSSFSPSLFNKRFLCCFESQFTYKQDQENIEKLIKFSNSKFDFSNEFHLKLLLGAYCSVTHEEDWPNNENE